MDNVIIERLCRSLKFEEVYGKEYRVVPEAEAGIRWFQFYNRERAHQAVGYRTPVVVYQAARNESADVC